MANKPVTTQVAGTGLRRCKSATCISQEGDKNLDLLHELGFSTVDGSALTPYVGFLFHCYSDPSYQAVLDADKSPERRLRVNELNKLHRTWLADLEHFIFVLKRSAVPKKAVDILVDAFDPIDERIAQMQNRAMTAD